LYPFRETVARGDVTIAEAMEKVDIGGPTMIRAAAKSHKDVLVVVDPGDYAAVLAALDEGGDREQARLREGLAAKVFRHISAYDAAVADFLDARGGAAFEVAPTRLDLSYERVQALHYGENPDQKTAFYSPAKARTEVATLQQHHNKKLSYNNILDLNGTLLNIAPFTLSTRTAVCIIKHTTPCGLGVADDL